MGKISCGRRETPIRKSNLHTHENWEVILHLTGTATEQVGDRSFDAVPGTVLVIPPKMRHCNYSEEDYTDMFFQCDTLAFYGVVAVQDADGAIGSLMNMLHKITTENREEPSLIAEKCVELIALYIRRLSKADGRYPFVQNFKNTLYENLSNTEFSVEDRMREMGYHPDYFRRCFKEVTGTSPLKYLVDLRINHAKVLLEGNFVSVADVAANCGFADPFYFSTCFRRHVGVSPAEYRKTKSKNQEGIL